MKKTHLFFLILTFLIFSFSNLSYGWQGRMGGMGDPYGLVQDESDFLIHPAKIANGKGINFYGGYRFNYTDVTDWNYNLVQFTPAGILTNFYNYNTSGDEYRHDGLLGAAFPLGPGRMGLFFEYAGKRGDYDGHEDVLGISNFARHDLTSDLDNFALRLLYGIPMGGFKLGGEFQLAYRKEENENWHQYTDLSQSHLNKLFGFNSPNREVMPFQLPYDSRYWEALFKGSLDGKVGPLDLEFTLRGGFIFGGDNSLLMERQIPVGTINARADMGGDVTGWRIGGDLWLRYPLANDIALPFLVRVDYQQKTRDGDGPGTLSWSPWNENYKSEEKNLRLTVGGGVDKKLNKGTKIAAGIYYNYLQWENNIKLAALGLFNETFDSSDCPAAIEHQVMLRLAGEHEFSPMVALRMGLNFFYGWVSEDFTFTYSNSLPFQYNDDISLNGSHWGIGASIGGTVKFQRFTIEPFINGGWQKLNLKGDGERNTIGVGINNLWEMDKLRKEWFIGGGFSIKFN